METTSSSSSGRFLPVLLALIVGVAIGWLVFRPQVPPPQAAPVPVATAVPTAPPTPTRAPSDHLIIVGPDASTLSEPEATIGWENQIHWQSNERQSLSIVFPVSGFPAETKLPPFADMKEVKSTDHDDWLFRHPLSTSVTASGTINPDLKKEQTETLGHAHGRLEYKYDQILAGQRKDGRIIIEW
jgi:hypothetical protein